MTRSMLVSNTIKFSIKRSIKLSIDLFIKYSSCLSIKSTYLSTENLPIYLLRVYLSIY